MKFIVCRTSQWDDETPPCKEAKRDSIVHKEGYITRDNGMVDVWSIEINNLDELVDFVNKYDSIIMGDYYLNTDYKEIEIYDDYRE